MKKKVYWIRIEQLQEVYKCMTQDDASIICQEHYKLVEQLPHSTSLTDNKLIVYWIENRECKMSNHLNEITNFEYKQLTISDILLKSMKGYYIKVEDVLKLNETIPFSTIDQYLSSYGLLESVNRVANIDYYYCWTKEKGLLYVKSKPCRSFTQITVEDILKLHSQRYENRLQKQKTDVVRGDDTERSGIQSRISKASITVGHLSYKAIKS